MSVALVVLLSASLITSLFFKEPWLWMDEVLSYLLVSDPSVWHLNNALVSGMDANPPVFANLYWLIGQGVSLNPQFLRGVSVVLFAVTIAWLYRYTTTLLGKPLTNFVLITALVALTYLNLSLSTQIRTYSLFLFISFGYFWALHQLILSPDRLRELLIFSLFGVLLVLTHNFGLFYAASSGAFFVGLWRWSKEGRYGRVIAAHGLVALVWLLVWYPSFAIQTEAGKPHSWIPLPTFLSFFSTVGELAPSLSSTLERRFPVLPVLRFLLLVGVWMYVALPRLRQGYQSVVRDKAFSFYLLSGFLYLIPIGMALVVSLVHTSVFISRYLWPGHLLVLYQLLYAVYFFAARSIRLRRVSLLPRLLPIYMVLLAGFLFYQNRKTAIFPSGILSYLPQLDPHYPVFVETADYFLPIWFHDKKIKIRYLLDWETASRQGNILSATVEHKILKSVREKYRINDILTTQRFNRFTVPHFYVIDESSHYQIEHFIEKGQIQVVRQLPIAIAGHRILECTF